MCVPIRYQFAVRLTASTGKVSKNNVYCNSYTLRDIAERNNNDRTQTQLYVKNLERNITCWACHLRTSHAKVCSDVQLNSKIAWVCGVCHHKQRVKHISKIWVMWSSWCESAARVNHYIEQEKCRSTATQPFVVQRQVHLEKKVHTIMRQMNNE